MQRSNRGEQTLQNDANKLYTSQTHAEFLHPTFSSTHFESILSDFSIIHISVSLLLSFLVFPRTPVLAEICFLYHLSFLYLFMHIFLLCAPTSSSYYWHFLWIGLENPFLFQQMVNKRRCLAFRNCCISTVGGQTEFYELFCFILFFSQEMFSDCWTFYKIKKFAQKLHICASFFP